MSDRDIDMETEGPKVVMEKWEVKRTRKQSGSKHRIRQKKGKAWSQHDACWIRLCF